jgi:hypothetical protein
MPSGRRASSQRRFVAETIVFSLQSGFSSYEIARQPMIAHGRTAMLFMTIGNSGNHLAVKRFLQTRSSLSLP